MFSLSIFIFSLFWRRYIMLWGLINSCIFVLLLTLTPISFLSFFFFTFWWLCVIMSFKIMMMWPVFIVAILLMFVFLFMFSFFIFLSSSFYGWWRRWWRVWRVCAFNWSWHEELLLFNAAWSLILPWTFSNFWKGGSSNWTFISWTDVKIRLDGPYSIHYHLRI